jgi:carboxyl-terminal processing protease
MYGPNPGDVRQTPVVPEAIIPAKLYYEAMKESARIIESHGRKIGYIHVWSYAGDQYQDLLEEMVTGKLAGADALVLDLRDGWGGASPEYLGIFNTKVPLITEIGRDGKKAAMETQWRKPAVMLINEGARSGKEILAYGFRKYGFGKLVGTKTAGYVMAGRPFILGSGNMLYLAVAGVLVDGERIEGVGVAPDIEVPMPLEYTHGKDPQLDKALELLGK